MADAGSRLTYTVWAWHTKVGRWIRISSGLSGPAAVADLTARQDRVRRRGESTRFAMLLDTADPPPKPHE